MEGTNHYTFLKHLNHQLHQRK